MSHGTATGPSALWFQCAASFPGTPCPNSRGKECQGTTDQQPAWLHVKSHVCHFKIEAVAAPEHRACAEAFPSQHSPLRAFSFAVASVEGMQAVVRHIDKDIHGYTHRYMALYPGIWTYMTHINICLLV